MATYKERVALFQHVLHSSSSNTSSGGATIDFERLRRLCFRGIPDTLSLRQLCWKLLLNYLPSDTSNWTAILSTKRNLYRDFVLDLCSANDPKYSTVPVSPTIIVQSPESMTLNPLSNTSMLSPVSVDPFPPSRVDANLIDTIDKDIRRTLPSMAFFHEKVVDLPDHDLPPRRAFFNLNGYNENCDFDKNYLAVERILYIFAKLNPGIGYIQGMNHVAFVIFYLAATDDHLEHKANAEADAFFLFHEVMTDYRDFFIDSMDADSTGINNAMNRLGQRISHLDPELWTDLSSKGLEPTFYAFRWFTCLCAQEFHIPDLLRLWDSVFADRIAARNRGRSESAHLRIQLNQPVNPDSAGVSSPVRQLNVVEASLMMDAGVWSSTMVDITDDSIHPSRQGQFLPDFMVALVLVHRDSLVQLAFDEGLLLLQQQPERELDEILVSTYRLILIEQSEEDLGAAPAAKTTDSPANAMNTWVNTAMRRAGMSSGGGHQRSRSLGVWPWTSPSSPTGATSPLVPAVTLAPAESQKKSGLCASPLAIDTSPRKSGSSNHRHSASLSSLGGMMWTKLKELGSTSP